MVPTSKSWSFLSKPHMRIRSEVVVRDTKGTGDHFEAQVVSPAFAGKTMVQQHKLVYAPLQDWLATGELHALALKTYLPE